MGGFKRSPRHFQTLSSFAGSYLQRCPGEYFDLEWNRLEPGWPVLLPHNSLDHNIYRYTLQGKNLTNREVFYTPAEGTPDGLTIDADGNLWAAIWDGGRVVQLSPEGKELAQILLPVSRPTSVAFGGADLRTLYITSASVDLSEKEKSVQPFAGALFSIQTQVMGLPSQRFILRA